MAVVNEVVQQKIDQLKGKVTINEAGAAVLPKDAFISTLVNSTEKDVKAAFAERDSFVAAATAVTGEAALAFLAANKDVATVTLKTKVINDDAAVTIHRSRDSRNPQTGEVTQTKGAVSLAYKAVAAKTGSGQTGAVVAAIKINAATALAD